LSRTNAIEPDKLKSKSAWFFLSLSGRQNLKLMVEESKAKLWDSITYSATTSLKSKRRRWFHLAAILTITLIAAWLRLWRLPDVPPGLDYDEAFEGLDALWMLKTGTPYLFMASNHGREALFLYPVAFLVTLLGASPFTLRLTSALAGILTIPLLYRLTKTMFRDDPHRDWLALISAAGLAVSLWHIGMSRVPLRAILVPLFFILTAYLFWRGWQAQAIVRTPVFSINWVSFSYFALAGVALGLSQYTYLSARLFPLVFLLPFSGPG
jgi:4-amino-4-deoxy-L-arabinose transferase-like glycosyltransferase